MIKIACFGYRENWCEYLFLLDRCTGFDVVDNGWLNKIAFGIVAAAAGQQFAALI
jgi:hypothetical protein